MECCKVTPLSVIMAKNVSWFGLHLCFHKNLFSESIYIKWTWVHEMGKLMQCDYNRDNAEITESRRTSLQKVG